jgi:hypothetical protein
VVGDGAAGVPAGAPYDRIIATCAVPDIPPAWIGQLGPGGLMVVDVRGEIAGSLAVLRKLSDDSVSGRFLAIPGHFMWLRAESTNPLRLGGRIRTVYDHDNSEVRPTDLDPDVLHDPDLRFVLQFQVPDLEPLTFGEQEGVPRLGLRTGDGSWAEIPERGTVVQGGPRRLWDDAERAARLWEDLGRPSQDRFGLTAGTDGTHRYWLDEPDGPTVWTSAAGAPPVR